LQIECASCENLRMNAYSKDLRIKALGAVDRGMPRKEAAGTFGISLATLKRWLKRRREGEDIAPRPSPGRTPRILATQEQRRLLWEQLEANDDATLSGHCELWERRTGVAVSVSTMSRAVRRLGWTFKKSRWWPPSETKEREALSGSA
jgi:transposase